MKKRLLALLLATLMLLALFSACASTPDDDQGNKASTLAQTPRMSREKTARKVLRMGTRIPTSQSRSNPCSLSIWGANPISGHIPWKRLNRKSLRASPIISSSCWTL